MIIQKQALLVFARLIVIILLSSIINPLNASADAEKLSGHVSQAGNIADSDLNSNVSQSELMVFGSRRVIPPLKDRVSDLEVKLFGHAEQGSLSERVDKITQILGIGKASSQLIRPTNEGLLGSVRINKTPLNSNLGSTSTLPPEAPPLQATVINNSFVGQGTINNAFLNLPATTPAFDPKANAFQLQANAFQLQAMQANAMQQQANPFQLQAMQTNAMQQQANPFQLQAMQTNAMQQQANPFQLQAMQANAMQQQANPFQLQAMQENAMQQQANASASNNHKKPSNMQMQVVGVGLNALGLGALHCPICRLLHGF